MLWLAFKKIKHTCSVQVRLRYDGDLFDLRRLKAKTKALTEFIRGAQYADDIAIFSDTPDCLQSLLTSYNDVAKRMGLCINTVKTEIMCIGNIADSFVDGTKLAIFSDTPDCLQSLLTSYNDVAKRMGLCINTVKTEIMCIDNIADSFVDGTKLANVTRFKYLGSYVSSDCYMKEELASRIQAISCAFGRLRKRVFDSHDLTASTKVAVYNQCLMPLLMYGSETWTLYQHEIMQLRTIQQRHLPLILNIIWDDYISNEEVLRRIDVEDLEVMLVRTRLR